MSEAAVPKPELAAKGLLRLRSDERLARRAARGDTAAFEAIFKRYHQDLYRFCLAMVGRPQDAQDALQNTMVKALRALPGERREIRLKPWLYRIARNEAVEILRRRREGAELREDHPMPAGEVAEAADARERLRKLLSDLEELPDRQRAMLVMRELGGVGFDEIGEAFETSGSVARQTLYEARLSLRQMEEGREMDCDRVTRELSDSDGRVARRREIRAHLRDCAGCRAFRESIGRRRGELAAIAPLPLAASAGLLHGVLGAGAGGGGATGGLAGTAAAGAGKLAAGSAAAKTAATVAVVATVGVTAADRGGVIDVPLGGDGEAKQGARELPGSPGGGGAGVSRRAADDGRAAAVRGGAAAEARAAADRARAAADRARAGEVGGPTAAGGDRVRHPQARHHPVHPRTGSRGRPAQLPSASNHGQQTAAGHKEPQAVNNPAEAGRGKAKAPPPAPARPAPPPAPPTESAPAAPEAPSKPEKPVKEPGPQAEGSPGSGNAPD
jgi:RNA polymerase sigma factor (sigma-70 family)